jgi:hypothetical protein
MRTLPSSLGQKKTAEQHAVERVRFGGIASVRAATDHWRTRLQLQRLCQHVALRVDVPFLQAFSGKRECLACRAPCKTRLNTGQRRPSLHVLCATENACLCLSFEGI